MRKETKGTGAQEQDGNGGPWQLVWVEDRLILGCRALEEMKTQVPKRLEQEEAWEFFISGEISTSESYWTGMLRLIPSPPIPRRKVSDTLICSSQVGPRRGNSVASREAKLHYQGWHGVRLRQSLTSRIPVAKEVTELATVRQVGAAVFQFGYYVRNWQWRLENLRTHGDKCLCDRGLKNALLLWMNKNILAFIWNSLNVTVMEDELVPCHWRCFC